MQITFLVFLILIFALVSAFAVIVYGYSNYYSRLYYKAEKYRIVGMWPLFILTGLFAILTIVCFVFQYYTKDEFFANNPYLSYISLVILLELFIIVFLSIYWKKKSSISKHQIKDFWQEDFADQLQALIKNQNIQKYQNIVKKCFPKYYERINSSYIKLKSKIEANEKFDICLMQIIQFNSMFTPKFSKACYFVELQLFLDLCSLLKSQSK